MKTGWKNNIHIMSERILNLILPRSCAGCRKSNEAFCENCQALSYKYGAQCLICGFRNRDGQICRICRDKTPTSLKSVLWAGRYDGVLREAVRQFKYRKRKELAAPLGKIMAKKFMEIYPDHSKENFLIIPVPLHFKKEHERGFNQAGLLAQEFATLSSLPAGQASIPLLTNSLLKVKETPAQVEVKDREKRIKNLEGAFLCNAELLKAYGVERKAVILIDDVATTGATLIHAAHALEKSGAEKIIGLVVAHGA